MSDRVWRGLVVGAAIAAGLMLFFLSGFNVLFAPLIVVALGGAAAVALLMPRRPVAAVGVVFLLAVFQRLEVPTAVGSMRLEQPAIAALAIATVWHRHRLDLPSLRPAWPLLASAAVYLGALTLSSVLVADEPLASMRVVIWSAASMLAGLLAALLLHGRAQQVLPWLAGSGAVVGVIGLVTACAYFLFGGPGDPRVFFPAYEPNLYASLLAMLVPVALEVYRHAPRRSSLAVLALLLVALGLGVTRAAYIGLILGLVGFFLLHVRWGGITPMLRRGALITVVCGLVGLALPALILQPRYAGIARPVITAVAPGLAPGLAPSPRPTTVPIPVRTLDTLEYRLRRVETGLREWQDSPIIGRGAYSYGQRHVGDRGFPEVIAVLPVLVLHDSGIVGLAALGAFMVVLAVWLWRAGRDALRGPPAIALSSSLIVMLVCYMLTTALHFAVTWIIIGAAIAAAWPRAVEPGADPPQP